MSERGVAGCPVCQQPFQVGEVVVWDEEGEPIHYDCVAATRTPPPDYRNSRLLTAAEMGGDEPEEAQNG